jgi:hypothetical protein
MTESNTREFGVRMFLESGLYTRQNLYGRSVDKLMFDNSGQATHMLILDLKKYLSTSKCVVRRLFYI